MRFIPKIWWPRWAGIIEAIQNKEPMGWSDGDLLNLYTGEVLFAWDWYSIEEYKNGRRY